MIYIVAGKSSKDTNLKNSNQQICLQVYFCICSHKNCSSFLNTFLHGFVALLHNFMYVFDCIPSRVSTKIKTFGYSE